MDETLNADAFSCLIKQQKSGIDRGMVVFSLQ